MTFERGYWTAGKVWRIPLRLHFTLLFGLLYVSGLRFAPGAWLGYLVLVVVHELGHAVLVRSYRLRVFAIEVHGLGGACWHEPAHTRIAESVIAWGGVLAQLLLFVAAVLVKSLAPPAHGFQAAFWSVMLSTNLLIMAVNLLPFPGFDGARAWQLPRLWLARRRAGRTRKKPQKKSPNRAHESSRPRARAADGPKLKLVRDDDGDFRFENEDDER